MGDKLVFKPDCDMSNVDGNVFAIIGAVSNTLKENDMNEEATEFRNRAYASSSYDDVLILVTEYVEVR